jgi:hypothetical protein
MEKKSRIDPKSKADFDAALNKFVEETGANMACVEAEQMRLLCRDAMTFTPPMPKGGGRGLGVAAYKAGIGKVASDIKRIFIPLDGRAGRGKGVFLRQIINSVKGQDQQGFFELFTNGTSKKIAQLSPVMRKIMTDTDYQRAFAKAKNYLNKASINGLYRAPKSLTTDVRAIHDRYKGAVGGRWPKGAPVGGPQYYVESTAVLNAYIESRQLAVGRVKAGWADASAKIVMPPGARNYGVFDAPWVSRNIAGQGQFAQIITPSNVSMTVTNMEGNANNVAKEADTENIVYGARVKAISSAVEKRQADAIKRANRKK